MKDKKVFWFDVETTGLDCSKHGIVQLAGMIEVNREIEEEFEFKLRPFPGDQIEESALSVHGFTVEKISGFDDPKQIYGLLIKLLGRHCDRYDRNDKFYPAGYNVSFDYSFLQAFFLKNNDKYFGSWFNHRRLDPLAILWVGDYAGKYSLENYKLETVAGHFGIGIQAHDALSDVKATREIFTRLISNEDGGMV